MRSLTHTTHVGTRRESVRTDPDLTTQLVREGSLRSRVPRLQRGKGPRVDQRLLNGMLAMVLLGLTGAWAAETFWEDPTDPGGSAPAGAVIGWMLLLVAGFVFAVLAFAAAVSFILSFVARPELEAKSVEVARLRASRGRLVDAGDAQRRKIERDLHDGVQPRLVALLLQLSAARRAGRVADAGLVGEVERELGEILRDLRALAAGILPPALNDLGLEAAVTELTGRMPFRVDVALPEERLHPRAEMTAYFVIAEALTNAAKHANAAHVTVTVDVADGRATVEIADDGDGGADASRGTGLPGLADRVDALDGHLTVRSVPTVGTTVTAEFSCAS